MQKGSKIKEKVDTTTVDAHVSNTKSHNNIVRPLFLITLSVLCLVSVHVSFLQNPKKIGTFFADRT